MALSKAPSEGHNTGLSIFEDYPARASRLSAKERKSIKQTARSLFETSPGDAISYLAGQRGYTNFRPDSLIGKLMAKPVDYERFKPIGVAAFQDLLSRPMTEAEWADTTSYAKAMGAKDPNSFQALLNSRILSANPGAVRSEADLDWERTYGPMAIRPDGTLDRGRFQFNPGNVSSLVSTMLGA